MNTPQTLALKKGESTRRSFGKKAKNVAQESGVSDWSLQRWHKEFDSKSGIAQLASRLPPQPSTPWSSPKKSGVCAVKRGVAAPKGDFEKGYHHLFGGQSHRRFEMLQSLTAPARPSRSATPPPCPRCPHRPKNDQVFEQNYQCYGNTRLVKSLRAQSVFCGKICPEGAQSDA